MWHTWYIGGNQVLKSTRNQFKTLISCMAISCILILKQAFLFFFFFFTDSSKKSIPSTIRGLVVLYGYWLLLYPFIPFFWDFRMLNTIASLLFTFHFSFHFIFLFQKYILYSALIIEIKRQWIRYKQYFSREKHTSTYLPFNFTLKLD